MSFGPLVSGAWLAGHHRDPDVRVVDLRWYLDGRSGRAAYEAGHVPGAVFVDLEAISGHEAGRGRHPLPEAGVFEAAMRAAGVGGETAVVVYDDAGGAVAARLWWLLRYFGHERAAVLDGGIRAWPGELSTRAERPDAGDFAAGRPRHELKVEYEDVRRLPASALLIDVRAGERYRGETEPVDPVAGHIPGARNAPAAGTLDGQQRFRPPDELRRRYEELGAGAGRDVVVYCGSGVNACHGLLAMELAGLTGARLYPGSWSEWCARAGARVATGEEVE
jgi:thiosulfate/3-mercaptopyruvate sulfurtransferase